MFSVSSELVGTGCYWKSPKLLVSNSLSGTDIYNYVNVYILHITMSVHVRHTDNYTL